jgi:hypothetical protein
VSKYYEETSSITVRLPDEEIVRIRKAVDKSGMSSRYWYRVALLTAVGERAMAKRVQAEVEAQASRRRSDGRFSSDKSTSGAITFRLTHEERELVDAAVEESGYPLNAWCRIMWLTFAGEHAVCDAVSAQLRRVRLASAAAAAA